MGRVEGDAPQSDPPTHPYLVDPIDGMTDGVTTSEAVVGVSPS
jgi:hypothetical protein